MVLLRSSREIEFVVPPTAAQYGSSRNINTLGVAGGGGGGGGGGARAQVRMATLSSPFIITYIPGNGVSGSKASPGGGVGAGVFLRSIGWRRGCRGGKAGT